MEYENKSWAELSEKEKEMALNFIPPPLDPGLRDAYVNCVQEKARNVEEFDLSLGRRQCAYMDNEAEEFFLVRTKLCLLLRLHAA